MSRSDNAARRIRLRAPQLGRLLRTARLRTAWRAAPLGRGLATAATRDASPRHPSRVAEVEDFLLSGDTAEDYVHALSRGLDLVRQRLIATNAPFSGVRPEELSPLFRGIDLDRPANGLDEALIEIERLYLDDAVYFHHPRYAAHLNCPIAVPALLGDVIASALNSSLDTWDQSAGGTFVERELIAWTACKLELGADADGVFTSGGTQSNLMALLLARDRACATQGHCVKQRGLPDGCRLRILASEASHFSVRKAAAILGLGHDAVIPVRCDARYRMDERALETQIVACRTRGEMPIAVVATAGTTDFGSIDPLPGIAAGCRRHGIWLHVDAAYGCGLLVSTRRRHMLAGIEHADSVTVDYHKSFFQPVSCSALLVRNSASLEPATYHAAYLNPASQAREGTPNQVDKSLQTTRRFDALKLWLTLRLAGSQRIGDAFDAVVDLAAQAHALLQKEPAFEVAHEPQLSTLVFRYRPAHDVPVAALDAINGQIRRAVSRSGQAVIAGTELSGRRYLKLTLLNPAASVDDVREILRLIKRHGDRLAARAAEQAATTETPS